MRTADEHERVMVGGIFLRPSAIEDAVAEGLLPEHIRSATIRGAYESALRLHRAGEAVTVLGVVDDMMARGVKCSPSLVSSLEADAAIAVTPVIVRPSARAILRNYRAEELRRECRRAIADLEEGVDPADVAQRVGERTSVVTKSVDLGVPISTLAQAAEHRLLNGVESGVPTGFADFDALTRGVQPGEMTIVAARPAMGKTAFGLQAALNASQGPYGDGPMPTLMLTLEMTAEQLTERAVTILARCPASEARREPGKIKHAAAQIGASPLFIRECPGARIGQISDMVRRAVRDEGVSLVVVDYLGLIRSARDGDSPYVQAKEASAGLKRVAMEHRVPLIALAQLNRGVEHRTDKKPMMADLRDSGDIEQDAALIAFLHRTEYYLKDQCPESLRGTADIIIAKNRFGPTGEVQMRWTEQCTRFDDLGGV